MEKLLIIMYVVMHLCFIVVHGVLLGGLIEMLVDDKNSSNIMMSTLCGVMLLLNIGLFILFLGLLI